MPPRRAAVPAYRLHRPSGQAVVTVRTPDGRRDVYLGAYDSAESREAYARVLAGLTPPSRTEVPDAPDVSVNELVLAFWRHAEGHYRRPDGTATNEVGEYRSALRPLRELFGHTPAADFGPLDLQAVRRRMIDLGWCRTRVNKQVGRLKRVFRWGVAQELVPPAVHQALTAVEGLKRGRSAAVEREPVGPAPDEDVEAVLPFLSPTVRAMVRLQRLTGMRPGEVRLLRPREVDRSGEVWVYRPEAHKTVHAGRPRAIPLGPRARETLAPFLAAAGPDEYVFSPARSREERYAEMRANRKSKVPPSQQDRRKPAGELKKRSRDRFSDDGYAAVVRRACRKAGIDPWHPHQLRHTYATEVRRVYGLEAAQAALGHAHARVSEVYAARDHALAARVAAEVG